MARYVAPAPDRERSGKRYQSPNQLLGRSVRARGDRPPSTVEVRGPKDMHLGQAGPAAAGKNKSAPAGGSGPDDSSARESRGRIESLEAELAAAKTLERTAVTRLERAEASARAEREVMLVEARTERERLQEELRLERERHDREVGKLRTLVDQRERELRTLALEMGKVQGRLEVAERKLLESGDGDAGQRSTASASTPRARQSTGIERWFLLPVAVAVTAGLAVLGWRHINESDPTSVHAVDRGAND